MSTTVETGTEIRPFHVEFPEEQIDDLRRRIAATRWPSKELVDDRSQGVQLATLQALARYWPNEYDFGRIEERLNALPQFITEIDGVDVHFIHVRSQHEDALPLIMTHGWPGSVIELLESIGPLTDPTAHGGTPRTRSTSCCRPLPGYGFSGEPTEIGWDPADRAGLGRADAPPRLHPLRRAGRRRRARPSPTRWAARRPKGWSASTRTCSSRRWRRAACRRTPTRRRPRPRRSPTFRQSGFGYFLEQATRPQTIGYALLDSPVALAAWMVDHDTDATTRSPARSSTTSPRATSPATTSSTTSRSTG